MGSQSDLQTILLNIVGHAYFQPPENLKLEYTCIVYSIDSGLTKFANNKPYKFDFCYQLIVISKNPVPAILKQVAMLPQCEFVRTYVSGSLHHAVLNLYY
jgi:hypothetical protein